MLVSKHEIKICERCSAHFECKVGSINNCQCATLKLSDGMRGFLEQADFDCLCINCLEELNQKLSSLKGKTFPSSAELAEGFHFYYEGKYFVFTENYHLLRGYCCQSGCRHCPYGYKKEEA
jgi:hypothetical protein